MNGEKKYVCRIFTKTKSEQNNRYNLFFCLYLNLVCCSHFRIVLPWPQLQCVHAFGYVFESITVINVCICRNNQITTLNWLIKHRPKPPLSRSLYLSVYQLKSVHFIVWHFKWMQILLHILVCEPYTHIVCLTIFRGKIFDFLCYTEFHI